MRFDRFRIPAIVAGIAVLASSVVSSTPAFSGVVSPQPGGNNAPLRTGKFCIFRAAKGAQGSFPPEFAQGHAGWGYQVDQNTFFYGSVENYSGHLFTGSPRLDPGTKTNFWQSHGTFNDMLNEFRSRNNPDNPSHYYTDYKCQTVQNPSVDAAVKTTASISQRSYNIVLSNCLTESVEVGQAYRAAMPIIFPKGQVINPNSYFDGLLNQGWTYGKL